jgi:tetratricopeptide (TPR) repeat protein
MSSFGLALIASHSMFQESCFLQKGNTRYALNQRKEALVALEQAIRLNPSYAGAYWGKVHALDKLGKLTEANTTTVVMKARES